MNEKGLIVVALLCGILSSVVIYEYARPKALYTLQGPVIEKASNAAWGNFIVIEASPKNHRAVTHLTEAEYATYHIGQTVQVTRMRDVSANQWDAVSII